MTQASARMVFDYMFTLPVPVVLGFSPCCTGFLALLYWVSVPVVLGFNHCCADAHACDSISKNPINKQGAPSPTRRGVPEARRTVALSVSFLFGGFVIVCCMVCCLVFCLVCCLVVFFGTGGLPRPR